MKFLSIREFFYKLNTIGFILLLLPVVAFIFLYIRLGETTPMITDPAEINLLLGATVLFQVVLLTTVHLRKKSKIQVVKTRIELSSRMDGYGEIFIFRMSLYALNSLIIAVEFYFTGSLYFTGIMILIVLTGIAQWPMRKSFCKLLGLNRSETEMVLTDGDIVPQKKKRTQ